MKKVWKQKIKELDRIIGNTPICEYERVKTLYKKRELLEHAFNNCEG